MIQQFRHKNRPNSLARFTASNWWGSSLFFVIGVVFLTFGIYHISEESPKLDIEDLSLIDLLIFQPAAIGLVFTLLGGLGISNYVRSKKQISKLRQSGIRTEGRVVGMYFDSKISVNDRHPLISIIEFTHPILNISATLESPPIFGYDSDLHLWGASGQNQFQDLRVVVYVDPKDPNISWADCAEIEKKIVSRSV